MSGPIANSIPDLTLLYAIMANIDYPEPAAAAANGLTSTPAAAAAAAAGNAKPRALGLPKSLVPLRDKHGDGDNFVVEGLAPLKGLRLGVYRQVSRH